MSSSVASFVNRFLLPIFTGPDEPGLWTISVGCRVVGSLVREEGVWRLSWFGDADPRLTRYAGPLGSDIDGLAEALGARLGTSVSLDALHSA